MENNSIDREFEEILMLVVEGLYKIDQMDEDLAG